jgi:hypothetical protein
MQSGKVEYERERLLGIANKFARGTTLIEIAVYTRWCIKIILQFKN